MKVGDRVKVVADDYENEQGIIVFEHNSGAFEVSLRTLSFNLPFLPHELELIEGE